MPIPSAAWSFRPVPHTQVTVADRFWARRLEVNRTATIPHIYAQCEQTHRIDALRGVWKPGDGWKPHIFWDSDVAKWIEGAAYSLATHPDPALEAQVDQVIEMLVRLQQPDGYLNSYFIQVEPHNRWKNLAFWHELYCAGHLIEAGVAHYQATGKRRLLEVVCRYADYIDSVFGPGKRAGCCGHEEIELALVRLFRATGQHRYLDLSRFFLDQRGRKPSVFQQEMERLEPAEQKSGYRHLLGPDGLLRTDYCQDHQPVREQRKVVGHAVRAMYLYSAMVDVGVETADRDLLAASLHLWEDLVRTKLYITGGIGPSAHNEGFTTDYDLPNETAYAETCAAVGLVLWAHRMLQWTGDGRFADVMERALYNGVLSGASLDGRRFFYVNPLESQGGHHRQDFFSCACCPPNVQRLLASLGQYFYSSSDTEAAVHLFVAGQAQVPLADQSVRLEVQTRYPWEGDVTVRVYPERPSTFGLRLRLPGWCRQARLKVNGQAVPLAGRLVRGYVRLRRRWYAGDEVRWRLAMPVERLYAHPAVRADAGCAALQRGPIVYCLEEVDNGLSPHRIFLPREASFQARFEPDLLEGVTVLQAEALATTEADWEGRLYRPRPARLRRLPIAAVPYSVWDNRQPGAMRVWIRAE